MIRFAPRVFVHAAVCLPLLACGNGDGGSDGAGGTGIGGSPPAQGGGGRGGTPGSSAGMAGLGMAGTPPQGGSGNAGSSSGGKAGSAGAPGGAGSGGTSPAGGSPSSGGGGSGGTAGSSGGGAGGTGGTGGTAVAGSGGQGQGGTGGGVPYVYVSTGNYGGTGKVRVFSLNETTLKLTSVQSIDSGALPSFITVNPQQTALFAGDESDGNLRAYSIGKADGRLTALNSKSGGGHPVFVSVDQTGKFLLNANYNEGNVQVTAIGGDLSLGAATATMSTGNQAHAIIVSPDNAYVFVPNKGTNTIRQLKLDSAGKLSSNTPETVMVDGGPRHITFHPSKPFAYAITELSNTLRAFSFDAAKGTLTEIDSKSTLPSNSSGNSTGAEIAVEPTGKFVYGSNRNGANSTLVSFSIDQTTGKLTLVGHTSTQGSNPRMFGIHPNGKSLFVANVDSNSVASFRLDPATGALTFVEATDVGDKPWCVAFANIRP